MKCWMKYKTFKKKNMTFQILNSCELFPYVSIRKCRDKECPNIIRTPLELLIKHVSVECLNIEPPSLITIEHWMSLIFSIDIYSKCN